MEIVFPNQILSYWDMCEREGKHQLQQGMNYELGSNYSVILMSVKPNAPYADQISEDGTVIKYEGHDLPGDKNKKYNQPNRFKGGSLTQNGLFVNGVENGKISGNYPLVRVYEKLKMGIWNYRGLFELSDYDYTERQGRYVFEFILKLTNQDIELALIHHKIDETELEQTRQIPGYVKMAVYERDKGMCRKCRSKDNLHFDHILPYSKGGTSLKKENIQLLCARHNLEKSAKLNI